MISWALLVVGGAAVARDPVIARRVSTAEPCFNLTLEDSFGDGWNGATYTISNFLTGTVVKNGTLEDGSIGIDEVCFNQGNGTCFTIDVTGGRFPNEISWNLGGTLDGTAPDDADFYVSADSTEIIPRGSCLTASPTVTPVPTPFSSSFNGLNILIRTEKNITVEGSIDFRGPLRLNAVNRRIAGNPAVFDGAEATSFFRLDDATLTLEGITLQNGRGGAGCIELKGGSTLVLVHVMVVNCQAKDGGYAWPGSSGGVFQAQSSSILAIDTRFDSNQGWDSAGVAFLGSKSKFEAIECEFISSFGFIQGGVAFVTGSSTFTATNSSFIGNSALYGGVALVEQSSTFTATNTAFVRNSASTGAVAQVEVSSTFTATNTAFVRNYADIHGGVAYVRSSSTFTALEASFDGNRAEWSGGVTSVWDSSTFTAMNSSFEKNSVGRAPSWIDEISVGGALVYVTSAGTAELYNSILRNNSGANGTVRCEGTGTIYMARLDLELTERFSLEENCVLFLYEANNDGTKACEDKLIESGVIETSCSESSGVVNHVYWSYPCGAGQWSSDGIEHGGTINQNDPHCDGSNCADSCKTCPAGRYLNFNLNRYLHLGEASCVECPVGRYLEDDPGFFTGNWWLHDSLDDCVACPAGRFADEPGQGVCKECGIGTYAMESGSIACSFVNPGFIAENVASQPQECPPGTFSVGGSENCTRCQTGEYQDKSGQTQCRAADPGNFVNVSGASSQRECPAGTFSVGGSENCNPCEVGEFQSQEGEASCKACPAPMTTISNGSTYCDACDPSYYWIWDNNFNQTLVKIGDAEQQCVDCCARCEDICDIEDEDDCVKCDSAGSELETLDVARGWWRATRHSLAVYECPLKGSCRGGRSTEVSDQCRGGHIGALCGACSKDFDYDVARNRCARCASAGDMLRRAGNLILIIAFSCAAVLLLVMWLFPHLSICTACFLLMKEHAINGLGVETADTVLKEVKEEEAKDSHADIEPRATQPGGLKRVVLTKLKIVVAAWQIASSTEGVFRQVRFPPIFHKISGLFGLLGFAIMDVGSLKCLFGWTYFDKLLFVTLGPFVVVLLGAIAYWAIQRYRGKLETECDRRKAASKLKYASLLFIFVVLPSISARVVLVERLIILVKKYFLIHSPGRNPIDFGTGCARFDRGNRRGLRVIAVELSISCRSKRYRRWAIYDGIMIAVWPVGATLGLAILLWSNRTKLNPALLSADKTLALDDSIVRDSGLQRAHRRYVSAMEEIDKLKIRSKDDSILGLEFLFEEYEPRCYFFPVFELARRLFLSSVLAIFFPGSTRQVIIGLLGSMCSCIVYSYQEAYIEDDDNVVSAVAQVEVVLVYFAALAIHAADGRGEKQAAFSGVAFGVVLVLIFFASFIVATYITLLEAFGYTNLRSVYMDLCARGSRTAAAHLSGPPRKSIPEAGATVGTADENHIELSIDLSSRQPKDRSLL